MKKKLIIIAVVVSVVVLALGLRHASLNVARSTLQSEIVRRHIEPFFDHDRFLTLDPQSKDLVPALIDTDDPFLSIEPNTKELCWTFTITSWHDAVTIYISLFGKPVSIGQIKWIDFTDPSPAGDVLKTAPEE